MAARKLKCLPNLYFIRNVHATLLKRFHLSTQKLLRDYTTRPDLFIIEEKCCIVECCLDEMLLTLFECYPLVA